MNDYHIHVSFAHSCSNLIHIFKKKKYVSLVCVCSYTSFNLGIKYFKKLHLNVVLLFKAFFFNSHVIKDLRKKDWDHAIICEPPVECPCLKLSLVCLLILDIIFPYFRVHSGWRVGLIGFNKREESRELTANQWDEMKVEW